MAEEVRGETRVERRGQYDSFDWRCSDALLEELSASVSASESAGRLAAAGAGSA